MKELPTLPILIIALVVVYFATITGCAKDYSCDRCSPGNTLPPGDTTVTIDTAKIDTSLKFSSCNICDSTKPLRQNSWSFKNYNSYVCGNIDTSFFDENKNGFLFWGDLSCSKDTGFNMFAVFDPGVFQSDRFNISTKELAFTLQDRNNFADPWNGMLLRADSYRPADMTVVVDSFINSTRLMVGRFYGYANARNKKTYVDGKFRFTIP